MSPEEKKATKSGSSLKNGDFTIFIAEVQLYDLPCATSFDFSNWKSLKYGGGQGPSNPIS